MKFWDSVDEYAFKAFIAVLWIALGVRVVWWAVTPP